MGKNTGKVVIDLISLKEYNLKDLNLRNRIVMPPMCMYSSDESGLVKNFHRTHYGARALGGVGLIILEATAITKNGRISSKDLGIWSDDHILGLRALVSECHAYGAKMAIQIAHAGRKSMSSDVNCVAPSSIPFNEKYKTPEELSKSDIELIVKQFQDGAKRALAADFDLLEIHGAHGYLIHEFLSPLTTKRIDAYGGPLENRTRFLKEILSAVKKVWPSDKPLILRVSADDYTEGGLTPYDMVNIINEVKDYIDMVHVSTGGLVETKYHVYPGYQVTHSEIIKSKCNIPTIAVGLIEEFDHIEDIINNNKADLVALGRPLLRQPSLVVNMAYEKDINLCPKQYERAYR